MSMDVKDVLEQTDWPALRKQMDAVRGLAGADPHTTPPVSLGHVKTLPGAKNWWKKPSS